MLRIRSILAPYDFSEHADRALDHAAALARLHEAHLDVLYAVEVRPVPSFDDEEHLDLYTDEPVTEPAERALERRLEALDRVSVEAHAERGPAVKKILTFADTHDTDLVVMATHGLTGLRRVLMGSTTRAIVDGAPCPVFLIPAFGKSLLIGEEAEAASRSPA